jgi:hypothetical protein
MFCVATMRMVPGGVDNVEVGMLRVWLSSASNACSLQASHVTSRDVRRKKLERYTEAQSRVFGSCVHVLA